MLEKTQCANCGKPFYLSAAKCPHCGSPNPHAETRRATGKGTTVSLIVLSALLIVALLQCRACSRPGGGSFSGTSQWNCSEYDAPLRVVTIAGEADVYSGVDRPNPSSAKGHISGGAAGVEASCATASEGLFYRLRGVDWWGWVRASDTR